jgi:hypothetical protein
MNGGRNAAVRNRQCDGSFETFPLIKQKMKNDILHHMDAHTHQAQNMNRKMVTIR